MKTKTITVLLILSLLFNIAFISGLGYRVFRKSHKEHSQQKEAPSRTRESLNLTEEQKAKLDEFRKMFSPKADQIRDRLVEERKVLVDLVTKEKIDSLEIENQLKQVGKFQMEMERKVVFQMISEKRIMNPEQREIFNRILTHRIMSRDSFGPRRPKPESGQPALVPGKSDSLKKR